MAPPLPKSRPLKADPLLFAVISFILVTVWRVQDIFPILGAIKLPILVELVVLGLFFADSTPSRRLKWIASPVVTMAIMLFVVMILGLPTSLWIGKGITFITRDFIPTFVLFIVVASTPRERIDLDRIAFGFLIGAMIYSLVVYLRHPMINGRLGGLEYYDANDFGLLLTGSMPFAVYFMRPGVHWAKRLFGLACMGLFVMMMIRSGSRGAFLAFIGVMLYTLFRYKAIPARLRIGAVGAGVAVLMLLGSASYWQMMGTILKPKDDYNMTEESGRKAVWKRGIGYMLTHPFLGVGIRAFPQAEGMLSAASKRAAEMGRGLKWSVAHNSFVEIAAECGVPGIVLFVSMIATSMVHLSRIHVPKQRKRGNTRARAPDVVTPDDQAYAQMIFGAFIAYIIAGFFVSAEYFAFFYILLGLTIALEAILRRRARAMAKMASTPAWNGPGGPRGRPTPHRPTPRVGRPVQWAPSGS